MAGGKLVTVAFFAALLVLAAVADARRRDPQSDPCRRLEQELQRCSDLPTSTPPRQCCDMAETYNRRCRSQRRRTDIGDEILDRCRRRRSSEADEEEFFDFFVDDVEDGQFIRY